MSEIHSYFIRKLPVENPPEKYDWATQKAIFIYTIADLQNTFTLYYSNSDIHSHLLNSIMLFTPLTITFQLNQKISQENLVSIVRNPPDQHQKNPFILVNFSPFSDTSRHFCAPVDYPNSRITIFDNPKHFPLPPPDILYSNPVLVQFTHLFNPNHNSYKFPRIRAIKRENSILLPPLSIRNGITQTTVKTLKDTHDCRLFIGFDDEETSPFSPNITPQECEDIGITSSATASQILEFATTKTSDTLKKTSPGTLPYTECTANVSRVAHLTSGKGTVIIHAGRFPGLSRARAVSLARQFANNSKPIEAFVLIPIHPAADTLDLASDLNPLLTSILFAAHIFFYLTPVPTTCFDSISYSFCPTGDPIRFAIVSISKQNRPRSNDLLPREISLGSEALPDDFFYDSCQNQVHFCGFIGLPANVFRHLQFPNTLAFRLQQNKITHKIFQTSLTNLYTILKVSTTSSTNISNFKHLLSEFSPIGLFHMTLRSLKTPSPSDPLLCIVRLGAIGGKVGVSLVLKTLSKLTDEHGVPIVDECLPLLNQCLKVRVSKGADAIVRLVQATRLINTHCNKKVGDTRPFHSIHHQGRVISLLQTGRFTQSKLDNYDRHPSTPQNSYIYAFDDVPLLPDAQIATTLLSFNPSLRSLGWFYTNDLLNPQFLLLAHSPTTIPTLDCTTRILLPHSKILITIRRLSSIPANWTADVSIGATADDTPRVGVLDDVDEPLSVDIVQLIDTFNSSPLPADILSELGRLPSGPSLPSSSTLPPAPPARSLSPTAVPNPVPPVMQTPTPATTSPHSAPSDLPLYNVQPLNTLLVYTTTPSDSSSSEAQQHPTTLITTLPTPSSLHHPCSTTNIHSTTTVSSPSSSYFGWDTSDVMSSDVSHTESDSTQGSRPGSNPPTPFTQPCSTGLSRPNPPSHPSSDIPTTKAINPRRQSLRSHSTRNTQPPIDQLTTNLHLDNINRHLLQQQLQQQEAYQQHQDQLSHQQRQQMHHPHSYEPETLSQAFNSPSSYGPIRTSFSSPSPLFHHASPRSLFPLNPTPPHHPSPYGSPLQQHNNTTFPPFSNAPPYGLELRPNVSGGPHTHLNHRPHLLGSNFDHTGYIADYVPESQPSQLSSSSSSTHREPLRPRPLLTTPNYYSIFHDGRTVPHNTPR